jgi:hypothetical protein
LNSAEPQENLVQPGNARLGAALSALVLLVLAGVMSVTAFWAVCTDFSSYDDMGCLMLIQKTFFSGHPLYDQTFTPYGPAYYAWQQFLHCVTRLPLSHDTTLLFTTFSLVTASLLCAGYVARMTRNLFLTAFTLLAVATLLMVMKCEPGHPQELCALLLTGMMFGGSYLTSGRYPAIILGGIGFCVGVLSMTKPNLGVFAVVAGAVSLSRLAPTGKLRQLLFGVSALAAVVLPATLMWHNLPAVAGYCVIESAAILLLVMRLARWQPDLSLPWKSFAAPIAGLGAALMGCAIYALATGTTFAGLARGLLLQHLGFDQRFSFNAPFQAEDVLIPVCFAGLVWALTGPARDIWPATPWVSSVLKFGVAPFMVVAVVPLGFAKTFIWSLPLIVATAWPSPRQPGSTWALAPRHFALSLAVLIAMWGYPVWGAQAGLSFFLLIPVAIVSCADAVRYGCWRGAGAGARPGGQPGAPASPAQTPQPAGARQRKTTWMAISYAAVAGVMGVALLQADRAAGAYNRLEPSGLRGSRLLHMPTEQADFYRRLVRTVQAHGRACFTMPGLGSLYFWANQDPPTSFNATAWMTLFTPDQQSRVVEDLQRTPDLCVIRWNPLVEFWTRGRDISTNKIVRYIEDNFVTVESFDGCDIMVRKAK